MTDLAPAEVLRSAATLMRERAMAASTAPWRPVDALHGGESFGAVVGIGGVAEDPATWIVATGGREPGDASYLADADFISSMHPLVALAVAGWLDAAAAGAKEYLVLDTPECGHAEPPCDCDRSPAWACDRCGGWLGADCQCWDAALAVARVYVGETGG